MYRFAQRLRSGFTLVELLVVIAIIALLISILLPSLARAREQAKTVQCLANLHDLISASISYANSDVSGFLIPVPPTLHSSAYFSASRRAWGGKSGLHKFDSPRFPELPSGESWHGAGEYGMWSTKNGMGPTKRPLNRFVYKNQPRDLTYDELIVLPESEAANDERLDYNVYRCPSDVGWIGGDEGTNPVNPQAGSGPDVIFGYGGSLIRNRSYKLPESLYNGAGNSYATDAVFTSGDTAMGAYMRRYESFGVPSRMVTYLEGKGFYACFWNSFDAVNAGGPRDWTYGNHGTKREHNVAFADGHASRTLFEVRTDVIGTSGKNIQHGAYRLRGGWLSVDGHEFNTDGDPAAPNWSQIAHLLMDGPEWQNHSQPAPTYQVEGITWTN